MVRSGVGFGRAADRRDTQDREEAAETTPGSGPECGQAVVTVSCCATGARGGGEAQGGWVGPEVHRPPPGKCQEAVGSPSLGPGGQAVREEVEVKPPPTSLLQWGAAGSCAPRNACLSARGALFQGSDIWGPLSRVGPRATGLSSKSRAQTGRVASLPAPRGWDLRVRRSLLGWDRPGPQPARRKHAHEGTGRGAQPPAPPAVPGPGEGKGTQGDIAATFLWLQK